GAVVTGDGPPPWAERLALQRTLEENRVELKGTIGAERGGVLADAAGEVALEIPAGALPRDTEIGLKEEASPEAIPAPAGYRLLTGLYTLSPAGLTFAEPATLLVRLAIPPTVKPENLVLGYYDASGKEWKMVPAVVDVPRGLVAARVRHFSTFAVLGKEVRRPFDDTSTTDWAWAREAVEVLAGAGIVEGVDGRRFDPGRDITRAELTGLLVRALDLPVGANGPAFKDVPRDAWYAGTTAAAVRAGLVSGYGDGTFRPVQPVTREELAVVLARALSLTSAAPGELTFADAGDISGWARECVACTAGAGLIKGYPDGTFRPAATATRAEVAVLIYRALTGH
ncbi:MAG: putative membrane protein, partial [Clostridia bacterium 62_21]